MIKTKTSKSDVYGILFGGGGYPHGSPELRYFSLGEGKTHFLAKAWDTLIILPFGGEIYYDNSSDERQVIKSLFGGFKYKPFGHLEAIKEHRNKILGSDASGLISILEEGKKLITKKEMEEEKNILSIKSLLVDLEENLFGLVAYKNKGSGIIEIKENEGRYSLGEEILSYEEKHQGQAEIIPGGTFQGKNGNDYNFSIVSCGDSEYLDLNGEKIEGTKVQWDYQVIKRVKFLGFEAGDPVIFYLDRNFGRVVKARIDLENKTVIEKNDLINGLSVHVNYTLEPVRSHSLHERLIKWSEVQKNLEEIKRIGGT